MSFSLDSVLEMTDKVLGRCLHRQGLLEMVLLYQLTSRRGNHPLHRPLLQPNPASTETPRRMEGKI